MAEWFSLGGKLQGPQITKLGEKGKQDNTNTNTSCLFLLNEKEIYNNNNNKGFEIWTQPFHHQHHHQNQSLSSCFSLGVGPSCANLFDESTSRFGLTVMRSGALGSGMNCQDCGNQAKKDCAHLRCRTCCRSRGFQCQTHVKSTWVAAAKRRERQHQQLQQHHQQPPGDTSKRSHRESQLARRIPSPIATTGLELRQFPHELNSPAMFQCVKVNTIETPEEQYAYQTAVNIGGHVFKGILYDQGPDAPYNNTGGDRSSTVAAAAEADDDNQNLNLMMAASTTTALAPANPFDASIMYPNIPLNTFMAAGTQFFPPPRS